MSGQNFDKDYVLQLLSLLRNHTIAWTFNNPVDLSITIDSLAKLLQFQVESSDCIEAATPKSLFSVFLLHVRCYMGNKKECSRMLNRIDGSRKG